jgi:hypothetical protein
MGRIFLLGDSFTDNLYARKDHNDSINEYLNKFEGDGIKPKWFSDHLESWGYEIHNFGISGASNYDIINRFARIDKKFREGDRVIINWTSFSRHNWLNERGENQAVHNDAMCIDDPYIRNFFIEQSLIREKSAEEGGFIATDLVPFLNHLIDLHAKYRPIIWSPFVNIEKIFENNKWFFWSILNPIFKDKIEHQDKLIIADEFPGLIDRHYGRYGNFYQAVLLRTVLEFGEGEYYTKDHDLLNKVFYNLKNNIIPGILP